MARPADSRTQPLISSAVDRMKLSAENETQIEPFINADEAAEFLSMNRLRVIRDARKGKLPGHPYKRGRGNDWFFLKSELARHMRGEVESQPRPFVVGKAQ